MKEGGEEGGKEGKRERKKPGWGRERQRFLFSFWLLSYSFLFCSVLFCLPTYDSTTRAMHEHLPPRSFLAAPESDPHQTLSSPTGNSKRFLHIYALAAPADRGVNRH